MIQRYFNLNKKGMRIEEGGLVGIDIWIHGKNNIIVKTHGL